MIPQPDELLVKFLLEETNQSETKQVEEWIAASEENNLYFQQLKSVWEESKVLQPTIHMSEEESWNRLKDKLTQPQKMQGRVTRWYYAAAVILVLLGLFFFMKRSNKALQEIAHEQPKQEAPVREHSNLKPPVIEQQKMATTHATRLDTLPDQSLVTLNKNSTLACPEVFANHERRVTLQGEAFFKITPNKNKPFFINASNDVEIRVVGTSFNVKSYTDFTEVIVETGIVEVRKFNRVVLLHPREKAKIRKSDSSIVVQKNTDKLYKYYRNKEFECDNLPLWRLVEVLNEAYGDSVVIGRKELRGLTLDTRFDNLPLENILELISETFDIKVEKRGNKYILK